MKTTQFLQSLWRDDRGQTTTEYILMLSVVVMIAMKFKSKLNVIVDKMTNQIDGEITTGLQN